MGLTFNGQVFIMVKNVRWELSRLSISQSSQPYQRFTHIMARSNYIAASAMLQSRGSEAYYTGCISVQPAYFNLLITSSVFNQHNFVAGEPASSA